MENRISAIIPAYNEATRIGATLSALTPLVLIFESIVIDDGSSDDTTSVAEHHGASRVLRLERNSGKGAALNEGLKHATGDILLFLDADLGETAGEAIRLLTPVVGGKADMTIAVLPRPAKKGGMGFVVRAARDGIERATGRRFESPLSGQRALTRELMNSIGQVEERFGVEVALTIDALRVGARVLEVPAAFRHRETGRDLRSFVHRWRQWRDVKKAVRARLRSP
ncbi:MAG: hypothetical protein AUJ92_00955 [Armatimonadetes bacterium CG2_30_59_28]|nr:glycosyltransferase family 2 protein [Armatimonadota bacterium]OIO98670.1 MAG: hypothetical protein AUJ92_00955 [Armatimonadetes bacterium CG2_30_59_28]PIU61011.1 MAG: glycosyl transferase [Armatimonadetes bacterium CG07_land_8_20_14_0_80_59_28]PIX41006.1 MAG: glycosyl transferase [Armatimonadetes bacterium CG_4_8_14_3_um_filter_58_9]PIY43533.1 MAG: glycosyl transferase [Armatimonadetes bacterium CG_4_10_14_3_um_filter_59_10]PJB62114.1 MAG: glycosyl transferase [Armatimonadetes bacterium CG